MPLVQDQFTTNAMAAPFVPKTVVTGTNSGPLISESTAAATRKKNLNKSPCAACRDLHKKCDISEGFPCNGCKSNEEKARLCCPTTKPPKNKKIRISDNEEQDPDQTIAIMKAVVPEPMNAPVHSHHMHFNSTNESHLEAPKQWSFPYNQADVQQYLPLFGGNGEALSNTQGDINHVRDNNNLNTVTGTALALAQTTYAGLVAGPLINTGNTGFDNFNGAAQPEIVHRLGHETSFGSYNEQAAFLQADQLCQQPFDFSEFSNVSYFPFSF